MTGAQRPMAFRGPDGLTLTGFVRPAEDPAGSTAEAARPPVVFVPGTGFCVEAYAEALAALPPDTAVHALNYRGHGGSDSAGRPADWDGLVADLRAYVTQEVQGQRQGQAPPAPVILAGHSMGAMVCLRLAAEAPELCAGLLLLEPPIHLRRGQAPGPDADAARQAFADRARKRRADWPSREEAAQWFAGSVLYRLWTPAARAGFVRAALVDTPEGTVRLATPPELEASYYASVLTQPQFAWAAQARCAGVLLYGLESPVVAGGALEDIVTALPLGVLLPVPGGHTFPMEHPAETGLRMVEGLRLLRGETGLALTESAPAHTG